MACPIAELGWAALNAPKAEVVSSNLAGSANAFKYLEVHALVRFEYGDTLGTRLTAFQLGQDNFASS